MALELMDILFLYFNTMVYAIPFTAKQFKERKDKK